jgi:hypothetical protein
MQLCAALRRAIRDSICLSSLRYHSALVRTRSPLQTILTILGSLFCLGYTVSILPGNLQAEENMPRFVDCPPYPCHHNRSYWHESRLSEDLRLRPNPPGYMIGKCNHDWNALRPQWRNWLCSETMPWLGDHMVSLELFICLHLGFLTFSSFSFSAVTQYHN